MGLCPSLICHPNGSFDEGYILPGNTFGCKEETTSWNSLQLIIDLIYVHLLQDVAVCYRAISEETGRTGT